uniref:Uncharacterized protein n=1 Tax=viral metagenome TaxID=1070528 RepID=A0A6C0DN89_9ZZZZ
MNYVDTLFGPLSKQYCVYFYFLSIFGFILLAVFLISSIVVGLSKRKGLDYYMQVVGIALGYAIFYFQNRLLHSMCVGTM